METQKLSGTFISRTCRRMWFECRSGYSLVISIVLVKVWVAQFQVPSDVRRIVLTSTLWEFRGKKHRCLCARVWKRKKGGRENKIYYWSETQSIRLRTSAASSCWNSLAICYSSQIKFAFNEFSISQQVASLFVSIGMSVRGLLTAQRFPLVEAFTSIALTALLLSQRGAVFATIFRRPENRARPWSCAGSALCIALAPRPPLT